MSAIFGLVRLDNQPVAQADLLHMSAALAHHGSDGGVWCQGPVGLGKRQRQFTALDSLEQPSRMSAGGQRVLVSDARIDNRAELITELTPTWDWIRRGSEIEDDELISSAYERWNEDCVHHLVGVYAFAIWDPRAQRLYIARSPIAAPALYYYATSDVFAFATAPSGLLALPFVKHALDEERLADMLVESLATPTATLYRDVYRLRTGHALALGREGLEKRLYWQPDLKREIRFARDEDYVAAFDELLGRVVRDYLRGAAPAAIMLSGGLDSSSLAVTAANVLKSRGERLAAFTEVPRAGFGGPVPSGRYADETPLVQSIAAMYDNLDLTLVRTDGRVFLENLDRLFFHLEMPFRNASNRVWIEAILQAAHERGMAVVLDGVQGNLTISWNGSGLLPGLVRDLKWTRALRHARAMAHHGAARSTIRALVGQGFLPILPTPLWSAMTSLRRGPKARATPPWHTWSPIHPDFALAQRVEARARACGQDFRYHDTRDSRRIRYDALMLQDAGAYVSAFRSMYGVDLRSPLADVRLAEFCLALPEEQYLHDGEPRALVRRAMAHRLPAPILANPRRGMQAADWYERLTIHRDEIAAELERLKRCEPACRALDLERMSRLVEHWPQGGWDAPRVAAEYGTLLERGLMVGKFLRWFAGPRIDGQKDM